MTTFRLSIARWSLALVSLGVLVLAVTYAFNAYPAQDDFCFAANTLSPAAFATHLYNTWSGRWPAFFLFAAIGSGDDLSGNLTTAIALLAILTWWLSFFIIADVLQLRRRVLTASVLFAAFWGAARGIGDTVYWSAGYFSYSLPFFLTCLAVGAATRLEGSARWAALPVALLAATMNELAGIALTAGALTVAAIEWRRGERLSLAVAIAAAVGTAIVVFAPGTTLRVAVQAEPMSLAKMAYNLVRPYESPASILFSPSLWAVFLFGAVSPGGAKMKPIYAMSAVASILAAYIAFMVATSATPTFRVLDYLFAIALPFALALGRSVAVEDRRWRSAGGLLVAGLIFTSPNVARGLHDLPLLGQWRTEHSTVHASLLSGATSASDYSAYPSIFPQREIGADADHDGNKCLARRFGLPTVKSVGPDGRRWQ